MVKRYLALVALGTIATAGLVGAGAVGVVGSAASAQTTDCAPLESFDPANFPAVPAVTNGFLPLTPGTRLVFEGTASIDGAPLPRRVEFTVTDMGKVIDGVATIVVWDVDSSEGQLLETELAFFAQDFGANVWNLGEYPEEFEGGVFVGAPDTWISGQEGAEGGIHMPGSPQVGLPEYLQGFAPSIEFLDCAQIVETGGTVCPPAGCFSDVLTTHERSPLDPAGGIQTKAHAPGVGIVEIGAIDDPEGETLALVEVQNIGSAGLDAARVEALKLEERAYQESTVYATTEPMYRLGPEPPPVTTTPPPPPPPPPTAAPPPTPVSVSPVKVALPASTAARAKPAPSSTVGRALATTGSSSTPVVMMATLVLVVGAALVVVTRRRRVAARLVGGVDDAPLPSDPSHALGALCAEAIALVDGLVEQRPVRSRV